MAPRKAFGNKALRGAFFLVTVDCVKTVTIGVAGRCNQRQAVPLRHVLLVLCGHGILCSTN
jgi:hypothetical protein